MQITYHLILSESGLAHMDHWQEWGQSEGIAWEIPEAAQIPNLNHPLTLHVSYHGIQAEAQICRESLSDVQDICDEVLMHLAEDHVLSLNIHIEGEQQSLYLMTLALAIAVAKSQGLCYIEGDGSFIQPAEALAEAKTIQAQFH